MGLGRLLHRAMRYEVTNTVTGASDTFTVLDGISAEWSRGAYSGGMALPGAWRASTLLADLLGSVPWNAYRQRGTNPVEKLDPTPPLLEQPCPPDTRVSTLSAMALDLIWHGNAIALIAARGSDGWPTALLPVPAEQVQVKRAEEWDDVPLPVGSVVYGIGNRWYSSDDVLHVKGPCRPGALRGMGVLENHLSASLTLASELADHSRNVNGAGVPTGVLKLSDPAANEETARAAKAGWLKSQRERTVGVLGPGIDYETVAWNPTETQLLEARKFSLHELCLIFGVPLSFLGVEQASRTYSNVEQEGLNLIKFSLGGHLARFEQALSLLLPRGTDAKANLDSVLRADTLARYQAHEIGIRSGFLTRDEARSLEDRPPLTPAQRRELTPSPAAAPVPSDDEENASSGAEPPRREPSEGARRG